MARLYIEFRIQKKIETFKTSLFFYNNMFFAL